MDKKCRARSTRSTRETKRRATPTTKFFLPQINLVVGFTAVRSWGGSDAASVRCAIVFLTTSY